MKCTKAELLEALHDLVGEAGLKTAPADLDNYGKDWTKVYKPAPVAIVLPANTDEVIALVKFAKRMEVLLVPSGGRTGLSGGAVAPSGELVVAFDRMNKILEFDPSDRLVVCEPGGTEIDYEYVRKAK